MHDDPRNEIVAALVAAIDGRSDAQTRLVVTALTRGAWPSGLADRVERPALEWVRRWGPARITRAYAGDCSCAEGRCAVCN